MRSKGSEAVTIRKLDPIDVTTVLHYSELGEVYVASGPAQRSRGKESTPYPQLITHQGLWHLLSLHIKNEIQRCSSGSQRDVIASLQMGNGRFDKDSVHIMQTWSKLTEFHGNDWYAHRKCNSNAFSEEEEENLLVTFLVRLEEAL